MTREDRITALYQNRAAALQRVVARKVRADHAVIEDACGFAWAQLVAHTEVDPDSPTTFGWLVLVATREGWHITGRAIPAADVDVESIDVAAADLDDALEAREASALLAQLPDRQRAVLTLTVLGLSRPEIAATLGWTERTVDRQLGRARARVRELRGEK